MPLSKIALLLGVVSFFTSVPLLMPIVGLALGCNSLLKKPKEKNDKIISIVAIILCAITIIV